MSNFDTAIAFVLSEEGGYVNDPNDPGGETNFGISKRAYPALQIADLTQAEATAIYQRDYWARIPDMEALSPALSLLVLDCAVNQGVGRAQQLLAQTHDALAFQSLRLDHYLLSPHWAEYGRGWTRRLLRGLYAAAKL